MMNWDTKKGAQLQLPDPMDDDQHPRLLWMDTVYTLDRVLQLCFLMAGMI